MRHQRDLRKHSAILPPRKVVADPIENAKIISDVLPKVIKDADAAGLTIISQYLVKALVLAKRVAVSDQETYIRSTNTKPNAEQK